MTIKETKRGFVLSPFEISKPYKAYKGIEHVHIEIDLNVLVDGYDYHDFPSSVDLFWDKSQVIELRDLLNTILDSMEK